MHESFTPASSRKQRLRRMCKYHGNHNLHLLPQYWGARVSGRWVLAIAITFGLVACEGRLPTSEARTAANRAPIAIGSISALEIGAGESEAIPLERIFRDPDGTELSYSAATSDSGVVAVSVVGGELTVVGVGPGAATVVVTATDPGGLGAEQGIAITVPNRAPEVRDVPSLELASGASATVALTQYLNDPDGEVLSYTVTGSDEAVVSLLITDGGLTVTAVARGEATVTITGTDSGGLSASQSFLVTVDGVTIQAVQPTVLVEGRSATISGSGFSESIQNNLVLIDGIPAPVIQASSTRLSILVPRADCLPPRQAELAITVQSLSDTRPVDVTPQPSEDTDLASGWYRWTYAGNGCLHLPADAAGAEWLIGVTSTSELPSSITPVTLIGTPGARRVYAAARAPAAARSPIAADSRVEGGVAFAGAIPGDFEVSPVDGVAGELPTLEIDSLRSGRDWERHNEIMARNQELMDLLRPSSAAVRAPARTNTVVSGDVVTLFGGDPTSCTDRDAVQAVVRLVGENAIWMDDIGNPSPGFTSSELADLDSFYSSYVKSVQDEYFGELSDLDGNGKITVVMTKEVNRQDDQDSSAGGWVWFGDYLSSDACPTSNQGEIFFGRVPDPEGIYGQAWSREATLDYYPSLITHEITHLVQFSQRLEGASRKTTWELEGGATLSEQLVAYGIFGHGSAQDRGYAIADEGWSWYSEWVIGMARFFGWERSSGSGRIPGAPEECGWTGRISEGNDGPSMLFRYAMGRWGGDYPGGEEGLMSRLTQSRWRGYASLQDITGWRIEQVLAQFYMAIWMDLHGVDWFASWDLADVWRNLSEETWLRPHVATAADYQFDWNIRAGSAALLRWSPEGPMAPTSIRVASPGGPRVPRHISVWALRIR